ncbi:snake venom serine protease pictobin-like [Protobothrops mucrosquamatus]|uniref:snake venom serine protease pictobin-like n=1 Tax=Protobothrops mucrosquamatus TaxID=103944 RepID=UPI000775E17C|nr:snake venom serine protease pictobin-like [Protobothrops mucrosquamatus]
MNGKASILLKGVHKNFTKWNKDIMLIRLNRAINDSTNIALLSLPSSPPSMGSVCHIMGWGTITSPNETYPDVPHCANINLFNYMVCCGVYPMLPASSRTLCAGILEGGIDTCHGDSHIDLVGRQTEFQAIVFSGPYPCAQPRKPALYIKVFDHLDWIKSIIARNTTATSPHPP